MPTRLSRDQTLTDIQHALNIPFSDGMLLLGYESQKTIAADQPLDVTIFWTGRTAPTGDYLTTVALRDAQGLLWSSKKSESALRFREAISSNAWEVGQFAVTKQRVQSMDGILPGSYDLVVTLFDRHSLQPLVVEGTTTSQFVLGTVEITPPRQTIALNPRNQINAPEAPHLIGYELDRESARPGDPLLVTLFWRTAAKSEQAIEASLILLDEAHSTPIPLTSLPPVPQGEWRTQTLIRVPTSLLDAVYPLSFGICVSECVSVQSTATLAVDAPDRMLELPEVDFRPNLSQLPLTTLAGLQINTDTIDLIWQVNAETAEGYRVFVHLLNTSGEIISQSDGEPAQWTRPTTGWMPNEYILDTHPLTITEDAVRLRAGFYLPETGERLTDPIEFALDQ